MKKIIINLVFIVFCFHNIQAQKQKPVYRMVLNEIEYKSTFKEFDLFKQGQPSNEMQKALLDTFSGATILDFSAETAAQLIKEKPKTILFRIPTDIGVMEISLVKVDLFAQGFTINTNKNELVKNAIERGVHYQGVVNGQNESIAAISIFNDEVIGTISTKEGNYVVGKIKENNASGQHIIYNDQKVNFKPTIRCDTKNSAADYKTNVLNAEYTGLTSVRCVKIYVESAYNIFQGNGGSVNATVNFLSGLFNQSAALYFNDGVYITLSQLFIWTSTSPYDGCSSSTACLNSFKTMRPTFNGDIGHMVSLSNSNGGVAAGFNGLCNSDKRQSECYSGLQNTFSTVPTYSWSVMVFTHEMGHLLGSRHTHACVWNGNNTAIDGCSNTEGNCQLAAIPAAGGTIMSYCHTKSVGINFTLGFGLQPGNVIRNNINTALCISTCITNADLYIKDQPADIGIEPNPDPTVVYFDSEDIWVRNSNDGFTNQVHQNPEYRDPAGMQPNYVYVRVRNRGFAASSGTERLKLYWAKAGSALSWPNPWNGFVPSQCDPTKFMGGQISPIGGTLINSIAAGNEQIFEFQWYPQNPADYACFIPNEQHHFCLLARVEAAITTPYGMTFPETTDLWWNVKNNNNIAWKNLSIVDLVPGLPAKTTTFFVGGAKFAGRKMKTTNLIFSISPMSNQPALLNLYDISINISKLGSKWMRNGTKGEGFRIIKRGGEVFLVFTKDKAFINNIPIGAGEIQAVGILVTLKPEAVRLKNYNAKFSVVQTDQSNNIIGGESFKLEIKNK